MPSLRPNPASPSAEPQVPSQPRAGSSPPPPPPPTVGTSTCLRVTAVGEVTHKGTVGQDSPGRAGDTQHGHVLQQDPVEVGTHLQELAEHSTLQGQGSVTPRSGFSATPHTPRASRCALPDALPVRRAPGPGGYGYSAVTAERQSHLSEGWGWRASAAAQHSGCKKRAPTSPAQPLPLLRGFPVGYGPHGTPPPHLHTVL